MCEGTTIKLKPVTLKKRIIKNKTTGNSPTEDSNAVHKGEKELKFKNKRIKYGHNYKCNNV